MARTKTIVHVEMSASGFPIAIFSNDPNIEIHFRTAGDPKHAKDEMEACGSCDHFHRAEFAGDCRNDDERFVEVN